MLRRTCVLALIAAAACAPAGGEDEGAEIAGDALVAGEGLVGPVEVHEDRLVLPRAGNEALLDLKPGRVLVGGPQARGKSGFLRKATSAEARGDAIVVQTEPAALTDLVRSGSVDARGLIEPEDTVAPQGVGASADVGVEIDDVSLMSVHADFKDPTNLLPVRSFSIVRDVKIKHGRLRFRPAVSTSLAIRRGKLERFDAIARGQLDAELDITVDTKTGLDLDKNRLYEDKVRPYLRASGLSYTIWESEPKVLPVQWIGIVPVVETVRTRVEINCDLDMALEMHAEATFSAHASVAAGARYANGAWSAAEGPSLDTSSTLQMTKKGAFHGSCGLRTEIGLYFYDLAGPTLSVTPYVAFDVQRASSQWSYDAWPGLRGALGGRMQVLTWELLRADLPLFDVRAQKPLHGTW
jgi:hypothetical protein